MLTKDILKEYIYDITIRNYTDRTIKGYRNNLSRFFKYCEVELGIFELEEISHLHIKKYLSSLKDRDLSPSYINTILKNIRSFFNYCYKEGYCINVAKKVSWARENKVVIKTFTDREVKNMLEAYKMDTYINARNKCVMAILFDTGIRNAELCKIKRLSVRETVIYIDGKGNKERVVPISPYLKKIMIKYERIRDAYLRDNILHYDNYFLSYRNKPLTGEAVERIVKIAGDIAKVRENIRVSPHTCRHYFAQAQLKNGLDIYSLSRLLGHDSVIITKRYLQGLEDKDVVEQGAKTSPLMNLKI